MLPARAETFCTNSLRCTSSGNGKRWSSIGVSAVVICAEPLVANYVKSHQGHAHDAVTDEKPRTYAPALSCIQEPSLGGNS